MAFFYKKQRSLDSLNVASLWAFLALSYFKAYTLTFGQSFEASALDSAEVYENVFAVILFDKAKTFAFVEPLNFASSLRHDIAPGCSPDKLVRAHMDGLSETLHLPGKNQEELQAGPRYFLV